MLIAARQSMEISFASLAFTYLHSLLMLPDRPFDHVSNR